MVHPVSFLLITGNIIHILYTLLLQPLEHMAPASVECRLDGRRNNKRNIASLKVAEEYLDVVIIVSCAVGAALDTLAALDTFLVVDVYNLTVIPVGVWHGAGPDTGVAAYTLFCVYFYHDRYLTVVLSEF